MEKNSKICVLGDNGLLGSALMELLSKEGYINVTGCHYPDIDLTNREMVYSFFEKHQPEYIFFFAAVAAGINFKKKYPSKMLFSNVEIISNVMSAIAKYGCKKLLNVSSALIYSDDCPIPYNEDDIRHIDLNSIDTPYTLSKSYGICFSKYLSMEYGIDVVTAIPCNFFGAHAPFEDDKASVVSSLIKRIDNAKDNDIDTVEVWGTGNAGREFLNSKDVADACLFLMNNESATGLYNVGRGYEFSIRETAETIKRIIGYEGNLFFDATKPEGKKHMILNVNKINSLGWKPKMSFEDSVSDAYNWYKEEYKNKK